MKGFIIAALVMIGVGIYVSSKSLLDGAVDSGSVERASTQGRGRTEDVKGSISAIIQREAERNGIPRGVLEGLIFVESGFDESAIRFEPSLCIRKGWSSDRCASIGLTQVVYGWHKQTCGLRDYTQLLDPETNIRCGAKVLGGFIEKERGRNQKTGMDTRETITARALGNFNGDRTGAYAKKVMAMAKQFGA